MLIALFACAPRLGHPVVTHGAVSELPLVHTARDEDRWYAVVDDPRAGRQLWFVDTGFHRTACDDGLLATLGVEPRGRYVVRGEVGRVVARKAEVGELTFGDHRIDLACVVRDLDTTSSITDTPEAPIAGVLGADVLRRFHVVLDPATATITLAPPRDEPLAGAVRLRREYGMGARVRVQAGIDGAEPWLIVDTGAGASHVDGDRLGLEPSRVVHGSVVTGTGGAVVRDLAMYDVTVELAGHTVGPVSMVDRPRAPWTAGLLGLDVLGAMRQDYDFAHRRAVFEPVEDVVPTYRLWVRASTALPAAGP